ncbi:MAG: phosphatidate cytidylyltransferase [Alphaproteobacteria bacterium]|nr:phosphatidate cytidylyltransferase [Alphaproteobacteria bacterium]
MLPGHGGFLDRFDGYLLVLPFVYLVLRIGGLDG